MLHGKEPLRLQKLADAPWKEGDAVNTTGTEAEAKATHCSFINLQFVFYCYSVTEDRSAQRLEV